MMLIRLPRTSPGRKLLRDSVRTHGLRSTYPDGSKIETIDWDELAVRVDAACRDYDRLCR